MTNITVHQPPKSDGIDVLKAQMRPMDAVRLGSLRPDPKKFYSRYENEVDRPDEFWIKKLQPKHVQHYVAIAAKGTRQKEHLVDEQSKLMAMTVVIKEYTDLSADNEARGTKLPTHFLAVLSVDELLRAKGVGSGIIRESIEWTRNDASRHTYRRCGIDLR